MELFHNSRDEQCRFPLGAVPTGTSIRIRLFSKSAALKVNLRTWNGHSVFHPMESIGMGGYEVTIPAPTTPCIWWYDFVISDYQGHTFYYGNALDQLGGEGALYPSNPPSFQVTVYDPAFNPPEYLRKGIMYQIFPDRFHRLQKPRSDRKDVYLHDNWQDIPRVDPDPRSGDNRALDFFGGSLQGIREKLGYLKDLGVTVLYLNPIFKARSNHRYDTGDYMTVDPILGNQEDFRALCKDAEKMGIRVLLDGVFSHTGEDSLYFNRYGNYDSIGAYQSQDSKYYPWYAFTSFPDKYACWWNIPTLPEVRKMEPGYLEYIMEENGVARHWIREGSSGWRLDVADELPLPFLQQLRTAVKTENPDSVLLGEVWEDASRKIAYGTMRSYCLGDTVDTVMNYPFRDAVIKFLTGAVNAEYVVRLVRSLQENYPVPFFYSLMNLMGSHDRARILNVLCDHEYTSVAHKDRGTLRLPAEARRVAVKRLKKMLSLFVAMPGIPALYYGDEAGIEGAADPFCRTTFPWDNIDQDIYKAVEAAFKLRHNRPVLKTGFLDISYEGTETLVLTRYLQDGQDAFGNKVEDADYVLRLTRDRFRKQTGR